MEKRKDSFERTIFKYLSEEACTALTHLALAIMEASREEIMSFKGDKSSKTHKPEYKMLE